MAKTKYNRVRNAFDRDVLATVCRMPEDDFGRAYGLDEYVIEERRGRDDFYYFRDFGSNILAVAHLDTVADAKAREARYVETEAGLVVYSRALDDRLGAYIILDLLPAMGIQHDILLTTGEESGQSTAAFFDHPSGKQYDWIIEFDRGGTDIVLYEYDDENTRAAVELVAGMRVGDGIFSDICELQHLGVKGFNWGVGYRDYHSTRAHAYLEDTFKMVAGYMRFHAAWSDTHMPHEPVTTPFWPNSDYRDAERRWNYYDDRGPQSYRDDEEPEVWDIDYSSDNPTRDELEAIERQIDLERSRADALDRDWLEANETDGPLVSALATIETAPMTPTEFSVSTTTWKRSPTGQHWETSHADYLSSLDR